MPLRVAIQMDPIAPINIDADSTFRIAEEAQKRGHSLFYYTPDRLAYQESRITARGWFLYLEAHALLFYKLFLYQKTQVTNHEWKRRRSVQSHRLLLKQLLLFLCRLFFEPDKGQI